MSLLLSFESNFFFYLTTLVDYLSVNLTALVKNKQEIVTFNE